MGILFAEAVSYRFDQQGISIEAVGPCLRELATAGSDNLAQPGILLAEADGRDPEPLGAGGAGGPKVSGQSLGSVG